MVDKFCFPSGKLSNELVELTPFSLPTHARDLYERSKGHPELYAQYPQGPYDNYESFIASFACGLLAQNNETLAFTIIDKTKNFLAGVTAFVDADPVGRSVTIGTLFILPPYQRTHIATNTIGLMLQYALTPHSDGGLGLIQVKWRLCSLHKGYARVAERMGFKYEGTERWFRLIKNGVARGKVGNGRSPPPSSEEGDVW
ncbi:acetyltransferase [Diaporthe sp. PMI_573]|nr:acetyltransferase [Diaporthaceae sp. PMI_573]